MDLNPRPLSGVVSVTNESLHKMYPVVTNVVLSYHGQHMNKSKTFTSTASFLDLKNDS